jgi:hypothetical protein
LVGNQVRQAVFMAAVVVVALVEQVLVVPQVL